MSKSLIPVLTIATVSNSYIKPRFIGIFAPEVPVLGQKHHGQSSISANNNNSTQTNIQHIEIDSLRCQLHKNSVKWHRG